MSQWLRALAALVAAIVLQVACERKAPGPADCTEFSHRALGITDERMLRLNVIKQAADNLVTICLTTPYDRQLIECMRSLPTESALRQDRIELDVTPGARYCFAEFERRQFGPARNQRDPFTLP